MAWIFSVVVGVLSVWLSVKITKAVTIAMCRKEIAKEVAKFDRAFPVLHVVDDTKKKQEDDLPKFGGF